MVTLTSLRYGVEVETTGQTRETVARAVQSVVGGTVRHIGQPACYDPWCLTAPDGREWRVVADSSLTDSPAELRAELVTPILTWDDMSLLQDVIRALRHAHCLATPTCGVHVHVDAALFTGKTLAILAKQIYANEELIFHAFAVSEERKARYTKPLDPSFIARVEHCKPKTREAFFKCWYGKANPTPQRYDPTRYYVAPRIMWQYRSYRSQSRRFVPHNNLPHQPPAHPLSTSAPPFTLFSSMKSSLSGQGSQLSSDFK